MEVVNLIPHQNVPSIALFGEISIQDQRDPKIKYNINNKIEKMHSIVK